MATNKAGTKRKVSGEDKVPTKMSARPWQLGLLDSMNDPELKVEEDADLVVIKDKYPKAKHHFLVIPKTKIANLKSLKKNDYELLEKMHRKGDKLMKRYDLEYRLGYHAIPSMSQVHLHAISQDFDSPCLKNKKHWNSFTTEYFVNSSEVMKMLKDDGAVQLDSEHFTELLKKDLRCHKCQENFKTIPALKSHITRHKYKRN